MRYLLTTIIALFVCSISFSWDKIYKVDDIKTESNFRDLETSVVDNYSDQTIGGVKTFNGLIPPSGASLPTSGYSEKRFFYNTTTHRLYISTESVSGTYSWKEL